MMASRRWPPGGSRSMSIYVAWVQPQESSPKSLALVVACFLGGVLYQWSPESVFALAGVVLLLCIGFRHFLCALMV